MKLRILIITACIFALIAAPASAKIWRVDSNTANVADFRNLQEAHDGASERDTLYVAGSGKSYGDLTLTKTLYIFGPGYFFEENPDTQAWPVSATAEYITFDTGSEGSLIAGLSISTTLYAGSIKPIYVKTNNINIRNTLANNIRFNNGVSNCIIMQNYFRNKVTFNSNCQGIIFYNNIIPAAEISFESTCSADFQYNLIGGKISLSNSIFHNNIIIGESDFELTNCDIANNISSGEQVGTDNGNQSNVNESEIFVGTGSSDGNWKLAEGSPATAVGTEGTDIGPYGGSTPYVISGVPNIPSIYYFVSPTAASKESGLPVHIKAKSGGK